MKKIFSDEFQCDLLFDENEDIYQYKIVDAGKPDRTVLLSKDGFNALAMHSPLVREILALAKDWKRKDDRCPWCGKNISSDGHARNCPRENTLEDVQALGCYDLEGDPILYKTNA